MASSRLTDTMYDGVSNTYFTEAFHSMLEQHILDLAISEAAQTIAIPDNKANQYHGDLFGLLTSISVPIQYHWAMMRCNGLYGPAEYVRTKVNLIQPSFTEIDDIMAIYRTSSTIALN